MPDSQQVYFLLAATVSLGTAAWRFSAARSFFELLDDVGWNLPSLQCLLPRHDGAHDGFVVLNQFTADIDRDLVNLAREGERWLIG